MKALHVLLVGPAPAGPLSRGGMATVVAQMAAHPDPEVRITVVPTYRDGRVVQRLSVGVGGMLRAALLVLRHHVDVLHIHLSHGGSIVRKSLPLWAARLAGVPAVVHGHSFDFGGWFDHVSPVTRCLVRAALPADRWLVLGRRHVGEYATRLHIPTERIEVLQNAIRVPERSVHQLGANPVRAVALGRLGDRKGSYDLLAAVTQLSPDVRLRLRVTLAGDGEVQAVAAALDATGVADTVRVAGWLDQRQRDQLLSDAHIFLLPSRDEGLPMALLEAMAWGLVPITTAVGSIGEVVTDGATGMIVEPGRPDQIAAALTTLVADDELRARLGGAARNRVSGFALDRWFGRLASLWTELAAAGTASSKAHAAQVIPEVMTP